MSYLSVPLVANDNVNLENDYNTHYAVSCVSTFCSEVNCQYRVHTIRKNQKKLCF